ncbi:hypothetical protein DV736_g4761, partial [Chaetothyriales sp. CBS 134916]
MAKPKFDSALCTRHLSEERRAQLPKDVWKFLLDSEDGKPEAVYAMKPAKIKAVAPDFVSSDIGRSYWPLAERYQVWQWEPSVEEVESFVADIMIQERKKHTEKNPTFLVDYDPQPPRTTPRASKMTGREALVMETPSRQRKNKLVYPSEVQKEKKLHLRTEMTHKTHIPPPRVTETEGRLSFPISHSKRQALQSPPVKRSIKPTEASCRIALEYPMDSTSLDTNMEGDGDTVVVGPPPREGEQAQDGRQGVKRSAESLQDSHQPPTPSTSTTQGSKRMALNRKQTPVSPHENTADLGLLRPFQHNQENSMRDRIPAPFNHGPTSAVPRPESSSGIALHKSCGLEFTGENIVKIPEVFLEYILKCETETWRAARDAPSAAYQSHLLTRAKIYRELAWDLENKVHLLAVDAEENGIVEKEYALMRLSPFSHQDFDFLPDS